MTFNVFNVFFPPQCRSEELQHILTKCISFKYFILSCAENGMWTNAIRFPFCSSLWRSSSAVYSKIVLLLFYQIAQSEKLLIVYHV